MGIFLKMTIESMRKNRSRTIITIIGVVLSIFLVNSVMTVATSFEHYQINKTIDQNGSWEVLIRNKDASFLEVVNQDEDIKSISTGAVCGHFKLQKNINDALGFASIIGYDKDIFKQGNIKMASGRLPENENEIVIGDSWKENVGSYKIGDTLIVSLGDLYYKETNELFDYTIEANYDNIANDEKLEIRNNIEQKEYTVVGFYTSMHGVNWYTISMPLFTMKKDNEIPTSNEIEYFIKLKNPTIESAQEFVSRYANDETSYRWSSVNQGYIYELQMTNVKITIYLIAVIGIIILSLCSILMIYNAFGLSFIQRKQQLGIISSVGASHKQLVLSILYEGIIIAIIGIPIGLILSVVVANYGCEYINNFISSKDVLEYPYSVHLSTLGITVSTSIGFIIVLLSAYLPCRSTKNSAPIMVLQQSDNNALSTKKMKAPRIISKFFGVEGNLAYKNYRRHKKSYRSIILALVISMVLFTSILTLLNYANETYAISGLSNYNPNYELSGDGSDAVVNIFKKIKDLDGIDEAILYKLESYNLIVNKQNMDEKQFADLQEYDNFGQPIESLDKNNKRTSILIYLVDDETFKDYIESCGETYDAFIDPIDPKLAFVNSYYEYNRETGIYEVNTFLRTDHQITLDFEPRYSLTSIEIIYSTDNVVLLDEDMEGRFFLGSREKIYIPFSMAEYYTSLLRNYEGGNPENYGTMNFSSKDMDKTTPLIWEILDEYNWSHSRVKINRNEAPMSLQIATIIITILVLVVVLIATTNILNTISSSIVMRKKEISMLRAIGLKTKQLYKMVYLEYVYMGFKAISYGSILTVITTYFFHWALKKSFSLPFVMPVQPITTSVLVLVFLVLLSSTYAISRVKSVNIIDSLKNELT